jgi:alpha-L-rhamnosidase
LGKTADASQYRQLAEKIRQAFQRKFYHPESGIYGTGLQTELSVPLYWGLTPDSLKARVAANLAQRVKADNVHLDVGLLGTKAILNALSENGYAALAYQLAAQETFPSWGWWIKNGATTLYENWPINAKSDISMNHIMFGEIGAWLYKGLAGIFPDEREPGFRHILLKPNAVDGLDYFTAEHYGSFGKIRSAWKRKGTMIDYEAVIPPNSRATLYLPDGRKIPLAAGTHHLQWADKK